jgi:hypothetical protein
MDTAQDRFGGGDVTLDKCHMVFARHLIYISVCAEVAILGRQFCIGDALDELLGMTTILNE